VIGVLDLQSVEANAFPEGDRRIMTAFAERASNAIEAAQLYERLNAYASEMEHRVEERTAELQQAKERLEIILDNSSDAIMLVDMDGVIQQVNDSFAPQFGIPRSGAAGVELSTLFVPEFLPVLTQALGSVAAAGKPTRIDLIACRRDGLRFDVEVSLAPVREMGSGRSNVICSVHDITSRKQAEQELRMALEKEKEVNELKSRFVSMVSHEFRTPLSTILSSSEAVKMYKDRMPEEKQLQHLDRIYSQVKRMVALLDDILVLSRAEAKGMPFVPTMTPLKSFCQDVVEDMQFIAKDHQIEFTYDGEQQPVPVDRELLRQILTNLFSNAIKYSPAGRRIWFDVVCSNSQALFRVRDEGIGIPEDDVPRMFEAFHRARNAGQVQGTGLGLAIIKRAVDAHGGKITFVSQVNKGTTFTLTLPLILPDESETGGISMLEMPPEDED
jgi:PAS domain S-box-containing protein